MVMNLEHLRTYVEVVKRESFSEAAKHLGITQPAVSHQIQKLERDMGVYLLDRKESGAAMTTAGEEFHVFALKVLSEEIKLTERLQGLTGAVSGKLILGASTVPGEYILPRLLGDFIELHPGVEASVLIGDTDAVAEMVMSGECDVGFIGAIVEGRGLKRAELLSDELVLIVPMGHPLTNYPGVSVSDLEGEKLIAREAGSGTMRSARQILQQAGLDGGQWQRAMTFGSTQAIVSAVEAGLGVAFVSVFAAQKSIECGRIRALRIDGVPLKRDLYVIYLENHLISRLQQEFLSFAFIWASKQPAPGN